MTRADGRQALELRPLKLHRDYLSNPLGSVLIEAGKTRVLCAASVQPGVPRWMREQNVPGGWLTCEYAMLPAAGDRRKMRERFASKPDARGLEIGRLIGRSLRAAVDLGQLGANTVYLDCDVLEADGGTRCASICGASVALELALRRMFMEGMIKHLPRTHLIAAVSAGIVDGEVLLDLDYAEDSSAGVDMNVVMNDDDGLIEIQGTAEGKAFSREETTAMLDAAAQGIRQIVELQRQVLKA